VPTLVLAGEKELAAVCGSASDLAATLREARGCLIRRADHAFVLGFPEQFAGILGAWFESRPLPDIVIPLPGTSTFRSPP